MLASPQAPVEIGSEEEGQEAERLGAEVHEARVPRQREEPGGDQQEEESEERDAVRDALVVFATG